MIRYEKTFTLDGAEERLPKEAYLKAGHVYEMMKVTVNGQQAGIRLAPPYQLPVGAYLKAGENTLQIEVATTPARDQLNYPQPPFDFSHEAMEPTGMLLPVGAYLKAGENTLQIEVATTPARDQLNYPQPPFDFSHEAMEPTGMFGEVVLFVKEEK